MESAEGMMLTVEGERGRGPTVPERVFGSFGTCVVRHARYGRALKSVVLRM